MATPIYTRQAFIQRIKKHMNDSFPNDSYPVSDNEMMYYIDSAVAFTLVGQTFQNAKVEGALLVPDAYLITYSLTPQQDINTNYWYVTLPQPPLSLPAGYDVNAVWITSQNYGIAYSTRIKSKRLSYRNNMPFPTGLRHWIENQILWISASDATSLLNQPIYVQMPSARVSDITSVMTIPDDALEMVFSKVVEKLVQRLQQPKDIIKDNLSAGNKTS